MTEPRSNEGPKGIPDRMNVLLIGGGGREHALARGIAASPRLSTLYATHTSNPGIAALAKPVDVPVSIREIYRLDQFCDKHNIGLVVIGPEDPLAEGYADALARSGEGDKPTRRIFGPTKAGAKLEADKGYAKQLMRAASIPTAEARVFTDAEPALEYVRTRMEPPVVKAAGLAKGKGVLIPDTIEQAADDVRSIMVDRAFGDAGNAVVIEERLSGPELSVLALTDGRSIMVLPPCQDHKRLGDGDTGPNTGGMGAFCPSPTAAADVLERVELDVLVRIVDTLRREGIDYRGVLYAGLMLTPSGPKVLEFNCRFGDPECQPLLARYKGDLLELLWATAARRLGDIDADWDERAACCIVLASAGYPDKPRTGDVIEGVQEAEKLEGVRVDLAGVKRDDADRLVTAGGRVLGVTALGATIAEARDRAYEAASKIRFSGAQMRRDIGASVTATA